MLSTRGERVPGNGNGNAGNRPIRFRRISDYDPFLDMDSLIAQIPCLVGSSQPLLLVYTALHKGWISEQIVSVPVCQVSDPDTFKHCTVDLTIQECTCSPHIDSSLNTVTLRSM